MLFRSIVIITPKGIWLEHSFRLWFRAPNNEVEYEALLAGLRTVLGMGARDVSTKGTALQRTSDIASYPPTTSTERLFGEPC